MNDQKTDEILSKELIERFLDEFYSVTLKKAVVVVPNKFNFFDLPLLTMQQLSDEMSLFASPKMVGRRRLNIRSKTRKGNLPNLRKIYSLIAKTMDYTFAEIGDHLDVHHSSVIYAVRTAKDLLWVEDPHFSQLFNDIINHLRHVFCNEPDATLSDPDQEPCTTQPVVPAMLYSKRYQATQHRQPAGGLNLSTEGVVNEGKQTDREITGIAL